MKFYNVFSWHIWKSKCSGLYYVRRWDVFGFEYLDTRGSLIWRTKPSAKQHASMNTLREAEKLLENKSKRCCL